MKLNLDIFRVLAVFLVVAPVTLPAQTSGQGIMFGTWKLNVAKSDFGEGPRLMAMTVRVTSDAPELIQFSVEMTTSTGFAVSYSFKGAPGGKEYQLTGSMSMYSYTEEPGVVHETQRDSDGTVTKGEFRLSEDGKQGIWLYIITSPDGTVIKERQVFDRVG